MRPIRKNYQQFHTEVNIGFQEAVKNLFVGNYHGTKCTIPLIVQILLFAACTIKSIFNACRTKANFDSHTLANTLIKILPNYVKLQNRVNETLRNQLPKKLFTKARYIAIDLVLIPYHGEHLYDVNEVYRSQAKSGTSHFHAYATACVVHKGFRYTVALVPAAKGTTMKTVVQQLLKQCRSIGLQCSLLLLDRGFYGAETISYLKKIQQPFIMPMVIRGRKKTKKQPAGGTRKYADWKTSGWDIYELKSVKKVDAQYVIKKTKVDVCVYCKNLNGKGKRNRRQAFVFVYYRVSKGSAKWFFEMYRKRFGIESSYRQSHQCRIRTSTRNPLLRLFYFALSMLLRNLWIDFEREVIMRGKVKKQKTSEYYGLDNFRNDLVKLFAESVPILTACNFTHIP